MADYPTHGSSPWDGPLKVYIDTSISEAVGAGGPWAPLVHTHTSNQITDFEDAVLDIVGDLPGGGGVTLVYYPEDYGAVGDGANDDYLACQAAIDAAYAAGGGFVQHNKSAVYGLAESLLIKNGVVWLGAGGRQNLTPDDPATQPGFVALAPGAQVRVGDWSAGGAAKPGGIWNTYVDGNYIGGDPLAVDEAGLVRLAGVDVSVSGLYCSRSAGDGIVYDGLQNSTVVGGMSTLHAGCALVLDNGTGAVAFLGGYYGTSGGGVYECRDTTGEANLYPFGPTQNTFTGTIFEAYGSIAAAYPEAPLGLPYPFHVKYSGRTNKFTGCNFTAGATVDSNCAVLIDASASIIAPSGTFDSCLFWTLENNDAVRVASAAQLSFIGQHEVSDDGTHHAASFLCIDTGTPQVDISGPVIVNGDSNGDKIIRTINGGTLLGTNPFRDTGQILRLRTNQIWAVRAQGNSNNSVQIEPNGLIRWMDPATGATHGSLQRATSGGNGVVASGRFTMLNSLARYPGQQTITGTGQTVTMDASTTSEHRLAFSSNATVTTTTITNAAEGVQLRIVLFGSGTNSIAWPSDITFAGGLAGPQPVNGQAVSVDLTYHSGLAKWIETTRSPTAAVAVDWSSITGKPSTFTPSAHTHPSTDISDSTSVGRSVLTASTQTAARTAISAFSSSGSVNSLDGLRGTTGTVSTAAATAAKAVTLSGWSLVSQDIFFLTITNGNTAASPTLSVNGGAAVPIWLNGAPISTAQAQLNAAGMWVLRYTTVGTTHFDLIGSPVDGVSATIAPGTVTTVESDQPATVTNSGTTSAAVFDFGIPRGGRGVEGPPGPLGNQIEQNVTGANATFTLDPYYGTDYTVTLLNQTTAFTAANLSNGSSMTLNVVEDGTGGWAFTFPTNWIGQADLVPDTAANKINTFVIWKSPLGYHIQQVYKGSKPSGIWTPNDLDNKIAWFNANSIPVDEGDTITTWVNDWVSGQALTIAGAPKLHIGAGNNKYAQFDGIADSAAVTHTPSVANPYTYAALVQTSVNNPVIGGANAAAFDIYTTSGTWRMHAGAEVTASSNSGLWTVIVAAIQTPSSSDYIRINGTATTGNASNTKTGKYTQLFKNNAGAFGAGKIAHLIKTNDLLTSPELVNIESYLGAIRDQLNGV